MTLLQLAPIVLALLLLVPLLALSRRKPDPALRSLATARDVEALTPAGALSSARRLRPSLPDRPLQHDLGLVLGRLEPRGPVLRASWEDAVIAVMAPRAGKTSALVVPAVLDAPGPVVATSNKSDSWAATAELRAEVGTSWLFDPQSVATGAQTWWWDPLEAVVTVEAAERLAGMFVNAVEDERSRDVWGPAAREYLSGLFLAARVSGRTVLDAYGWLTDERSPAPVQALRAAGFQAVADGVAGIQGSPAETRGSVLFTARVAVRALRDPNITAWVVPPATALPRFDPTTFVESADTLLGSVFARPTSERLKLDAPAVAVDVSAAQPERLRPRPPGPRQEHADPPVGHRGRCVRHRADGSSMISSRTTSRPSEPSAVRYSAWAGAPGHCTPSTPGRWTTPRRWWEGRPGSRSARRHTGAGSPSSAPSSRSPAAAGRPTPRTPPSPLPCGSSGRGTRGGHRCSGTSCGCSRRDLTTSGPSLSTGATTPATGTPWTRCSGRSSPSSTARCQAAVRAAERHGGWLPVPLVAALDEAANVVRIGDLPQLYSHLGSRGIIPLTILQSYSQAVGVWGESGAKTLWGAATVKVVGAGMDDSAFAEDLSRLVGDHDVRNGQHRCGWREADADDEHQARPDPQRRRDPCAAKGVGAAPGHRRPPGAGPSAPVLRRASSG